MLNCPSKFLPVAAICALLSALVSCGQSGTEADRLLARVEDRKLYQSDIVGMVTPETSAPDSAAMVSNYVETWVKKQLMLVRAEREVRLDKADLERRIADYRNDLVLYEFKKQYVRQHLDTVVNEQEIRTYYQENPANFELKQNIVRGTFISLPRRSPRLNNIRRLLRADSPRQMRQLQAYCFRYARSYTMTDSSWIDFDELVNQSPFREIPNKVQFLKQNKFAETADEQGVYLLRLYAYNLSSQISPLTFVREQIRDVILNQRKIKLVRNLEKQLYKEARADNLITIHN